MDLSEIMAALEAILFVAGDGVPRKDICLALEIDEDALDDAVHALESRYDYDQHGLRLMQFEKKLQLATRAQYTPYVERVLTPLRRQSLTQSAMETLSVVAYRQPVTRMDIEAVRGVRCERSLATLVQHGLIREVGRKDVVGRPILYGTTEEFLHHFGLSTLDDMPTLLPAADLPDPPPEQLGLEIEE